MPDKTYLSLRRLTLTQAARPAPDYDRPKDRAECRDGERPCPFVGCRYHLALESKEGALRLNIADTGQLEELQESCALDVADQGPHTLPEVAHLLAVSRQRISQVEIGALRKLRGALLALGGASVQDTLEGPLFSGADLGDGGPHMDAALPPPKTVKMVLRLPEAVVRYLRLLAPNGDARTAATLLCLAAADGIRLPAGWQRAWVMRAFDWGHVEDGMLALIAARQMVADAQGELVFAPEPVADDAEGGAP